MVCAVVFRGAANSTAIGKPCNAAECTSWTQGCLQNGV